jgi:hypothetical protein
MLNRFAVPAAALLATLPAIAGAQTGTDLVVTVAHRRTATRARVEAAFLNAGVGVIAANDELVVGSYRPDSVRTVHYRAALLADDSVHTRVVLTGSIATRGTGAVPDLTRLTERAVPTLGEPGREAWARLAQLARAVGGAP